MQLNYSRVYISTTSLIRLSQSGSLSICSNHPWPDSRQLGITVMPKSLLIYSNQPNFSLILTPQFFPGNHNKGFCSQFPPSYWPPCQLQIGVYHGSLPSTSTRIKSCAVAVADFQCPTPSAPHPTERSLGWRRNETLCAQGKTGRTGLKIVRYYQKLIL